jgi:hypothetical protein
MSFFHENPVEQEKGEKHPSLPFFLKNEALFLKIPAYSFIAYSPFKA